MYVSRLHPKLLNQDSSCGQKLACLWRLRATLRQAKFETQSPAGEELKWLLSGHSRAFFWTPLASPASARPGPPTQTSPATRAHVPTPFKFNVFYLCLLFILSPDAWPHVLLASSDSVLRTQLKHPHLGSPTAQGSQPLSSEHESPGSASLLDRRL